MGTPVGPAYELRQQRLLADLADGRAELRAAVDRLTPAQQQSAGLFAAWSLGELLAHLGYWAGWATQAIHLAEQGRLPEHDDPQLDRDDRNLTVARIATQTELATVRAREAASADALAERLRGLDPELLDALWSDGTSTVEHLIEINGGAHYRQHAAQVRAVTEAGR